MRAVSLVPIYSLWHIWLLGRSWDHFVPAGLPVKILGISLHMSACLEPANAQMDIFQSFVHLAVGS